MTDPDPDMAFKGEVEGSFDEVDEFIEYAAPPATRPYLKVWIDRIRQEHLVGAAWLKRLRYWTFPNGAVLETDARFWGELQGLLDGGEPLTYALGTKEVRDG